MHLQSTPPFVAELESEWLTSAGESIARPIDFDAPQHTATLTPAPAHHPVWVAEGDCWPHDPKGELLDALRKKHGYLIHQTAAGARPGDGERRFWGRLRPPFSDTMDLVRKVKPSVVLYSGGTNDIDEAPLAAFINPKAPGVSPLREEAIDYLIQVIFRRACDEFIGAMKTVAAEGDFKLRIVSLGPDCTVKPWLEPAFLGKGYSAPERREIIAAILDKFRQLQSDLAAAHPGIFHAIDLRGPAASDSLAGMLHSRIQAL